MRHILCFLGFHKDLTPSNPIQANCACGKKGMRINFTGLLLDWSIVWEE